MGSGSSKKKRKSLRKAEKRKRSKDKGSVQVTGAHALSDDEDVMVGANYKNDNERRNEMEEKAYEQEAANREDNEQDEEEEEEVEKEEEEEEVEEEEEEEEEKEDEIEVEEEEEEKENEEEENEDEEDEEEEEGEDPKGPPLESYSEQMSKALIGDLSAKFPENVKVVRIFTSSTFTDTSVERNTLMERIYPRIKQFCQQQGYEFQVVDMRWGVRDESTDDHLTSELCMRELRACQELSTGPNFITFLGQKYGYRPFPPKIPASEFEKLASAVGSKEDKDLLYHWFRRDDNIVPAEYLLQPITVLLPDYRNYSNNELRKKASGEWWAAFERMQVVFREAADKALTNKKDRLKYYMSVTEDEIRRGIINARDPKKHCFWFKRDITDLEENINSQKAGSFIDKTWGTPPVADTPALKFLSQLREVDLPNVLPKKNTIEYKVKWNENGIDPKSSPEHAQYIEKLCKDFYDQLTKMVLDGINENEAADTREAIAEEIFQHSTFCQKKCKTFFGRKEAIASVKEELLNSDDRVVVLYGESGCGKTSLMAKIATQVKDWPEEDGVITVCRFIGTSPDSSSIRPLIRSICLQLCKATGQVTADIPEEMKALVEYFPECLEKASENQKVVLVLDSLDQLSVDDSGRQMEWLPRSLPYNVYVIMSTLPGEQYQVLPNLRVRYNPQTLMEVPQIPMSEAGLILDNWLKAANRALQPAQRNEVMISFKECPLPLYLKLAFDESCRWKSYTPMQDADLAPNITDIIRALFDRVERIHGKTLVSHSLGYITASKNGLTEPELEDLLSLDDDVLNDVYQYWTPPIRRLPPLLWIRIRADIKDYLIDRGADGTRVIYWYHRQFIEVARERYLSGDQAKKLHANMSDYFLGTWADGKKKPYTNKKGENLSSDRLVAQQPLTFGSNEDKTIFNLRKLSELPYHLFHSGQYEKMKDETLCNFEFLLTKLRGTSIQNVLDDYASYLSAKPSDPDVKLMNECLRLSVHPLTVEPAQLSTQLLGRMFKFQDREEKYPYVCKILKEAKNPSVPCFLPNQKFLTAPGGALVSTMALGGYGNESISMANDGKTMAVTMVGSEGLEVKIMDYQNGKQLRKLVVTGTGTTSLYRCNHNILSEKDPTIILLAGGNEIVLFNTETGQIIQKFQVDKDEWFSYYESSPVAYADDEKLIVAIARNSLRVFNVADGKVLHDMPIKGVDMDNKVGSLDARGHYAVYNLAKTNTVHFVDLRSGQEVNKITVKTEEVKDVKITSKNQVVVMPSFTLLLVYDLSTAKLVREITKFKMQEGQCKLQITDDGRKAVSTDMFEILITDLETGEVTPCLRSSIFRLKMITRDANTILSTGQDFLLRVYDKSREDDDENVQDTNVVQYQEYKIADSITTMTPSVDKRHVIAMANIQLSNQMTLWDTFTGEKVRHTKGLTIFPNPIRCINMTRCVGYIYDKDLPHYRVFDLKTSTIEKTLQGPACKRMNAFGMIDDKRLLSFSRGRRNLKVWNTESGKVVDIIKFNEKHDFQEMLMSEDGSVAVVSQHDMSETYKENTTLPLIVYNTKSRQHKKLEIKNTALSLYNAKVSCDGKYLVTMVNYSQAMLWDLEKGVKISDLKESDYDSTTAVEINVQANVIVTASGSGGVKVWELSTGKIIHQIPGEQFSSVFLTEDGRSAITRHTQANSFIAYDVTSGRQLAIFNTDGYPNIVNVVGDRLVMAVGENPNLMIMTLYQPGKVDEKTVTKSPFEGLPVMSSITDKSEKPTDSDPLDKDKKDTGDVR